MIKGDVSNPRTGDKYRESKKLEYARRWHARVTRMYRWVLAHERAERAWASRRALNVHAHTVALAYARELGGTERNAPESARKWRSVYFDEPDDSEGTWVWDRA